MLFTINYNKHPSAREAKETTIYLLLLRMKLKNRNLYKRETVTDLHYASNHTEDVRKGNCRNRNK